MKKTLIALAAMAATGAFAQVPSAQPVKASSVTLFGVADVSVSNFTVDSAGAAPSGSITIMDGSGRNSSSRLGFRGTEDLGGGMAAAFWLEAGVNIDNGTGANTTQGNTAFGDKIALNQTSAPIVPATQTLNARQGLTFNRASTVSLLGTSFGEIRLGRDYATTFWNNTVYDPFGTVGVGSAMNVIGGFLAPLGVQAFPPGAAYPMIRTSNAASWLSPNWGGVTAQLQYALAENASFCTTPETAVNANTCPGQSGDGELFGVRVAFNAGPLSLAGAYNQTKYGDVAAPVASTAAVGITNAAAYRGNYTVYNLAGSYSFGDAKVIGQWGYQGNEASTATVKREATNYMIGGTYTMGAFTLKGTYAEVVRADGSSLSNGVASTAGREDGAKDNQWALGVVYDFSKRTAIYGTYSQNQVKTGATTAGGVRATLGLHSGALGADSSATATGLDIGLRHAF